MYPNIPQPGYVPPNQYCAPGQYPPSGQYAPPGQYPPPGSYPPPVSILHLGILLRKVTNLLVDMFRLAMLLVLVAPLVPGIVLSLDILAFIQMSLLTSSQ